MNDATRMKNDEQTRKAVGTAYLLWILLAIFGAHRFYLDRTGTAAGQMSLALGGYMLFTLGLGALMWLALFIWITLDGFLIPAMVRERNGEIADL